jgi:NAD(P)-dependent dehydrogenase (short-subunit alcohol dehydrogenase family)
LKGKSAVITGAASGVGLATALQFLDSGLEGLIAVDIAQAPPAELNKRIEENPRAIAYLQGDVRREDTAARFAKLAEERFGRIDILVNNAGVAVVKPIHEHTEEEWNFVMDTNVKALFWSARIVIPMMMRQQSGVILNTGSISGHVGLKSQGAYGPSKGALHQLTKQMAIEYAGYGIRVNAVALGTVDTSMLHRAAAGTVDPEAFLNGLKEYHPLGRIATSEEAACFFTYLASDLASFFTGAILSMDGGFIAQ